MKKKLCMGVLTFCDDSKSPERFEILKRCLKSLERFKREDVFIYVWDNNSSDTVKDYIASQEFLDEVYFSKNNLFDNVAVNFLAEKAKSVNAEFACYMDDDILLYDHEFLDDCLLFMESNKDCGALRVLKYEFDRKELYDKFLKHPNMDVGNAQRHFNQISKQPLNWESCGSYGSRSFYKNNWHFYTLPTICRTAVFDAIVPKEDCRPLQGVELHMMTKYHELGLKIGVLDKGAMSHLGVKSSSSRIQFENSPGAFGYPEVSWESVTQEINGAHEIKLER